MVTTANRPSVSLLLCLPQSTSIQLYKRYSVLNPGPSIVQHTLVCANSRPYLYSHPYLLYILGKPILYQSVTASTWISLSRTVLGILVQDTHPLTSHIALVAMVGIWMCLTAQFSFLTRQWGLMLVDWFSCPVVACKDGEGSVFQKCSQCLQVVCLCQLWDTFPIVLCTLFNMVTAGV